MPLIFKLKKKEKNVIQIFVVKHIQTSKKLYSDFKKMMLSKSSPSKYLLVKQVVHLREDRETFFTMIFP